jgi:capsular exopolysaccharide synthesis family protein
MSKVYEALKRAQREGRWHESSDDSQNPADSDQGAASRNLDSDADSENGPLDLAAEQEIRDSTSEASQSKSALSLDPYRKPGYRLLGNGKPANGTNVDVGADFSDEAPGGKLGRLWRFWRNEWSTHEIHSPALIVHQESLSRAGEQFQVLRANLESWASEHGKRVILITSALPGEGKSFVALNLAVALADAGSHVLLVDADLRAPSLHRAFNLVPLSGLLPYLEGKAEFAQSIQATSSPRLSLMAAAGVTLSAPEAFASSRMRALIEHARKLEPPNIVLIDAPAALAGPEAQILSKLVDAALVVVGANDTPRASVTKTLEMIKGVSAFSVVLNRFQLPYSASRNLRYRAAKYKLSDDAMKVD